MANSGFATLLTVVTMKSALGVAAWLLMFVYPANAQAGFNHSYDFNLFFHQFRTVLVDNDTIVFIGNSNAVDSPYIQSALIGRVDSFGNVLSYNTIRDSLGGYLDVGENIAKTSDGNYAFTSAILFRKSDALYKFGKDLSLKSVYEFTDTVNLAVFYKGIIALDNGYLLSGYVRRPDHKYDAFARKLDSLGNTMWVKLYGSPFQSEYVVGMSALTDTTFILCGGEGSSLTDPDEYRSRVWIIDSSGIVLKTWYSLDSLKAMGIKEARPLDGGGIIAFSQTFLGYNPWGDYMLQPTLIKFDDDLQIEWIKRFGPAHSSFSYWEDLRPTPDGNFIGVGKVAPYDLADLNAHLYGWLYKFTPEGDSIWARADLSTIPYQSGIDDNVFGGVDFLSSGSIVAGGNSYINGQLYGWIIKVTPDGCIDTLLCQPSAARPAAPVPAPAVFPNPASGQAYVRYSLPGGAEFQLYDAMGRLALQQRLPGGDRQETLLLAGLASGIYYWQITAAGEMLAGGKLVLH